MDEPGKFAPGAREDRAAAALATLLAAARLGGEAALADFRLGRPADARVSYTADNSPVTSADLAVDAKLAEVLRAAFPEAGWLSEESADDPARLAKSSLLVLDPIDGTRAFMSGDPCWTVAIALVEEGRPIAGVVHAPALGETFAASLGRGATLNGEPIRAASLETLEGVRVAGPRPLVSALAAEVGFNWTPAARTPSLAYRLASVAAGRIPLGLAGANSHDWDICAADIILREAGAGLLEAGLLEDGEEVGYNRASTRHAPLIAAPAPWLPRLAQALATTLAAAGRRA
jgi:myo-inositol-1(or 4)-monophosphatase